MKRPLSLTICFWLRIGLMLFLTGMGLILAKAKHDVAPIVENNATVRWPINRENFLSGETKELARDVDVLYKKVSKLESNAQRSEILHNVFETGWFVYYAIFCPFLVALLQVIEKLIENRAKARSSKTQGLRRSVPGQTV